MQKFKIKGKPLLGKKKKKKNMRLLKGVITIHSARTQSARANQKSISSGCVPPLRSGPLAARRFGSTWKERKNNAKFSGFYVCPCTHNVRAHALRWDQNICFSINCGYSKLVSRDAGQRKKGMRVVCYNQQSQKTSKNYSLQVLDVFSDW